MKIENSNLENICTPPNHCVRYVCIPEYRPPPPTHTLKHIKQANQLLLHKHTKPAPKENKKLKSYLLF